MSNRTLFVMTAAVIVGILVLLGINMTSILTGEPPNQKYLKFNDVRGMAVEHNQLLYTLNFKQQNAVIDILNFAVPIVEIKEGQRQPPNFEKLVVYQFDGKPDLLFTPVTSLDKDLIFSVPQLVPNGYLMELSEGDLGKLLSQTYD